MLAALNQPQPGPSTAQRSGNKELVAGSRPRTQNSHTRAALPQHNRVNNNLFAGTRCIATNQLNIVPTCEFEQSVVESVDKIRSPNILWYTDGQKGPTRPRPHRSNVGERDGQGLVPQQIWSHCFAAKVD